MEKNSFIPEITVVILLVVLLALLINPFSWWMPDMMLMTMIAALAALFAFVISFVWRERPRDERETAHVMLAGRYAFMSGTLLLVIGIVVQSWQHQLDAWLPITLGVMVMAKVVGIVHGRLRH